MQRIRRALVFSPISLFTTPEVNSQQSTPNTYSDLSATDAWITEWMTSPQAATAALHLGRFADPMYFLRSPIGWKPNKGQEAHQPVTAPSGFVTDFASIPRIFWTVLPKDGAYTYAAILHDFMYWDQKLTRPECDQIFKYCMQDFPVSGATIESIYRAVRLGGGFAWDNNTSLKKSGEKRVLLKFPSDPTTTWPEWKKDKQVFK